MKPQSSHHIGLVRNLILPVLLTLICSVSIAQTVVNDAVIENKLFKPYNSYFESELEWVYTHFNKSAYIQGDDIWFTTYVLNPASRRLNFNTSKLYAELWSPEKKLVSRKILFVEGGTANNYFHLPDSLAPGTYCFRTYTSWMRNFYPDNDLNTLITILGKDKVLESELNVKRKEKKSQEMAAQKPIPLLPESKSGYDIQFLPESGTLLEGADNVIGVKATDRYGKGIIVTGTVFSADNKEVISFATNDLGFVNMTIPLVSNEQYRVKVVLPDGTTNDMQLPKPEPKGVIIQVNALRPDVVWFRIQTNEATLRLNKTYLVLIHANGIIFNNYRMTFSKETAMQFRISKKELEGGIVCATVFDENMTPVAERIFYNHDTIAAGNLTVKAEPLTNDSVKVNIHITDSLASPRIAQLSISVLPGETLLNQFGTSLRSESVFRPALRGPIENPDGYFEKNDIVHAIALDNLLLTQGWRKYEWPEILKDTIQNFTFPNEIAFTIEGRVKNWLKNKPELNSNITLISPQNNLFSLTSVDTIGEYKYDKVFLADSTWIIASASSDKGKNWNRVLQMSVPASWSEAPDFEQKLTPPGKEKEIFDDVPQLTKGNILLQEVLITGAKKKSPFADNPYVGMMDRVMEITKENYNRFHSLEMLLQVQFNIRIVRTQDGDYSVDMGRGNSGGGDPLMMIDGMRVESQDLITFPIELVEAVAVNKSGLGGSMDGSAGTIAVKTRTTPLFTNSSEATNIKRLMVEGYAAPAKYFEPKYAIIPGTSDYDKYAAIFWKPDLVTDTENNASIKFKVPNEIKSISLRIEGISFEGKTFLNTQKVVLPGRE